MAQAIDQDPFLVQQIDLLKSNISHVTKLLEEETAQHNNTALELKNQQDKLVKATRESSSIIADYNTLTGAIQSLLGATTVDSIILKITELKRETASVDKLKSELNAAQIQLNQEIMRQQVQENDVDQLEQLRKENESLKLKQQELSSKYDEAIKKMKDLEIARKKEAESAKKKEPETEKGNFKELLTEIGNQFKGDEENPFMQKMNEMFTQIAGFPDSSDALETTLDDVVMMSKSAGSALQVLLTVASRTVELTGTYQQMIEELHNSLGDLEDRIDMIQNETEALTRQKTRIETPQSTKSRKALQPLGKNTQLPSKRRNLDVQSMIPTKLAF